MLAGVGAGLSRSRRSAQDAEDRDGPSRRRCGRPTRRAPATLEARGRRLEPRRENPERRAASPTHARTPPQRLAACERYRVRAFDRVDRSRCASSRAQPAYVATSTAVQRPISTPLASPSGCFALRKGAAHDDKLPVADAGPLRDVPVDWEALEDAFENNAPEVHSYLHLTTGEVLRVVDGVADPQMHARIASDANYLRIDPVSSREQYRWMERFIPMVEDPDLRGEAHPRDRRQGRVPPVQGRAHGVRRRPRALVHVPQRAAAHVHGGVAHRARDQRGAAPAVGRRSAGRRGAAPDSLAPVSKRQLGRAKGRSAEVAERAPHAQRRGEPPAPARARRGARPARARHARRRSPSSSRRAARRAASRTTTSTRCRSGRRPRSAQRPRRRARREARRGRWTGRAREARAQSSCGALALAAHGLAGARASARDTPPPRGRRRASRARRPASRCASSRRRPAAPRTRASSPSASSRSRRGSRRSARRALGAEGYQERHVRAAIERHVARGDARKPPRSQRGTEPPRSAEARDRARAALVDRIGGPALFAAAMQAEGIDEARGRRDAAPSVRATYYVDRAITADPRPDAKRSCARSSAPTRTRSRAQKFDDVRDRLRALARDRAPAPGRERVLAGARARACKIVTVPMPAPRRQMSASADSRKVVDRRARGQHRHRGVQVRRGVHVAVDGDARRGGALARRHGQSGAAPRRACASPRKPARRALPVRSRGREVLLAVRRRADALLRRRRVRDLRRRRRTSCSAPPEHAGSPCGATASSASRSSSRHELPRRVARVPVLAKGKPLAARDLSKRAIRPSRSSSPRTRPRSSGSRSRSSPSSLSHLTGQASGIRSARSSSACCSRVVAVALAQDHARAAHRRERRRPRSRAQVVALAEGVAPASSASRRSSRCTSGPTSSSCR